MKIYYRPYLEGKTIIETTIEEINKIIQEEIEIFIGYGLSKEQAQEAATEVVCKHIVNI